MAKATSTALSFVEHLHYVPFHLLVLRNNHLSDTLPVVYDEFLG